MVLIKSGDNIYPLGFFTNCPVIRIPYKDEPPLSEGELQTLKEMNYVTRIIDRISPLETVLNDLGILVTPEILENVTRAVIKGELPTPKVVQLEGEISQFAGLEG